MKLDPVKINKQIKQWQTVIISIFATIGIVLASSLAIYNSYFSEDAVREQAEMQVIEMAQDSITNSIVSEPRAILYEEVVIINENQGQVQQSTVTYEEIEEVVEEIEEEEAVVEQVQETGGGLRFLNRVMDAVEEADEVEDEEDIGKTENITIMMRTRNRI